ncbi:hypothetical protein C5167_009363 [Papaver somniferum]|uniref:Uncharacterized protein n=1 Tax=Papaver somniferum TaxID=3469 RepID=A0A4Y7K134_PAPSO|nr:hypothetical protein C5167_009363 [Papaver somniferum]
MGKLEFFHLRDTCAKVLETSLRKLGVEKLSKDDVQKMQWEVLEAKIGSWIHFTRIDVRMMPYIIYFEEKGYCLHLKYSIPWLNESGFFVISGSGIAVVLKGKTNNGRWVVYNEENGIQALYRHIVLLHSAISCCQSSPQDFRAGYLAFASARCMFIDNITNRQDVKATSPKIHLQ